MAFGIAEYARPTPRTQSISYRPQAGSLVGSPPPTMSASTRTTSTSTPSTAGLNPAWQPNQAALAGLMETLGKKPQQPVQAPQFQSSIQANPMQEKAFGATQAASGMAGQAFSGAQGAQAGAEKYANSLADRSNESITNAMQRGRDTTAQALSDVRAGAGMRGGGPGSGLSGVLQTRAAMAGNRQNQALNASLTDVALQREGEARRGVTEAAGGVTGAANAGTSAANAQTGAAAAAAGNQADRERTLGDLWKFGTQYSQQQQEANRNQQNYITELAIRSMNPWTGFS